MSLQRTTSLIMLVSMVAGSPLTGQMKAESRTRIQEIEVKRSDLKRFVQNKNVKIDLRDGSILNGRIRKIEHTESTSLLFIKLGGRKEPEPVPINIIRSITYRGKVPALKAILPGMGVVLAGSAAGASGTNASLYIFGAFLVGMPVWAIMMHKNRPHVVLRIVP